MFLTRRSSRVDLGRSAPADASTGLRHPHRRPLGHARPRRPGRVTPRPQPCLTPLPPRPVRRAQGRS